ncbi:MAG: flagellar basal body P-ring formation chaperone FlgA [Verrucomicrobiales bacterium]|nr:flagellar basal body P-ring formation chaperone FlgA [Verrucomicrobiales bacterium]
MRFWIAKLSLVLVVIFNGPPSSLLAADGAPAWQLRPTAQVGLGGIYLDELFVNPPASPPHVRLANSSVALGQTVSFTRAQVTELLLEHAPDLAVTNWGGSTQIKITRRKRQLDETELKSLLTGTLQREFVKEKGELDLRLTRPWVPVAVPDDPLKVKVLELPVSGVTPNFIVRFELSDERDAIGTWQVPVQARVWRDVLVAGSALRRGQPVKDADIQRERRDVLTLRDTLAAIDIDSAVLEIAENIPAGTPLTVRSIRLRPIVRRGKVADAVVQDGALSISVKVEILEDGVPGQLVRVRNIKSKREFRGKVENEEMVLVPL